MPCSDHSTGAALTRLEVKTPAAARRGPVFTTRARSGLPFALIPAAMPAAVNPFAAVTLTLNSSSLLGRSMLAGRSIRLVRVRRGSAEMVPAVRLVRVHRMLRVLAVCRRRRSGRDTRQRQSRGLGEAQGDVHALHCAAGGALRQV